MNKTRLSVATGLAYDRLVNYLHWLEDRGLIREAESVVKITESGMETYGKLVNWIIEYVGKLNFPRRQ